ncbi:Predicted protein [Mesomycoplasma hyopneumoniae 168]|uniref:Uncharacterized protein n=1 Tax=Mesomycoplasma hyopneumoniae (strain 168) TaxID=907287 RepID=E4QTX9_MESH1|nr:Predicted protein [Mesomycoplasma hyopneumoniae 168]
MTQLLFEVNLKLCHNSLISHFHFDKADEIYPRLGLKNLFPGISPDFGNQLRQFRIPVFSFLPKAM